MPNSPFSVDEEYLVLWWLTGQILRNFADFESRHFACNNGYDLIGTAGDCEGADFVFVGALQDYVFSCKVENVVPKLPFLAAPVGRDVIDSFKTKQLVTKSNLAEWVLKLVHSGPTIGAVENDY